MCVMIVSCERIGFQLEIAKNVMINIYVEGL